MDPQEVTPFNESLPTPVRRLPHEGDAEPEPLDGGDADPASLPPIPPAPFAPRKGARRPTTKRGPGQGSRRTTGHGAPPPVPRRKPGSKRG